MLAYLRSLLGIASLEAKLLEAENRLSLGEGRTRVLMDEMAETKKELNRLRMVRRDQAGQNIPMVDWETVQAMKLAELNKEQMQ